MQGGFYVQLIEQRPTARAAVALDIALAIMLDASAWTDIVAALETRDVDANVAAAERLHAEASVEDVPKLLALLRDGHDFFTREAAAWPLAELVGPTVLRELFAAYQKGFDEGHDNDGFTAALIEVPALFPTEARPALLALVGTETGAVQDHAKWLLAFCK